MYVKKRTQSIDTRPGMHMAKTCIRSGDKKYSPLDHITIQKVHVQNAQKSESRPGYSKIVSNCKLSVNYLCYRADATYHCTSTAHIIVVGTWQIISIVVEYIHN